LCDALSTWNVTVRDSNSVVQASMVNGNFLNNEINIGNSHPNAIPTGSTMFRSLPFSGVGTGSIEMSLDRGVPAGNDCATFSQTVTFNTEIIPRVGVDVCDVIASACNTSMIWSALTLTRISPTEIHGLLDTQELFDLGCFDGTTAWIDFRSNAALGFNEFVQITDGAPLLIPIVFPAFAAPALTGLSAVITTGPDRLITLNVNTIATWTPAVCQRITSRGGVNIGSLPPYTP